VTARRPIGLVAIVLAAAAVLAGCLGDAPASLAPSPTREPEPTPVTSTFEIGTSVWYEGLVIHVERATAVLDVRGGPVDVSLRIENRARATAELQATIFLRVGGELIQPTRESRVPAIPPESEVSAVMTYELQAISSVDDAGVQIGDEPNHTGFAPLTPAAGEAVTLEPRRLELSGTATAGELRIALTAGLQRWDLPDWSQELAADRQAIIVNYDATFIGDFPGGYPFRGANVALRLPDGTDVPPRADGHSQSVELLGPGRTKRRLFTRFEIPAGVAGAVAFVVIDGDKTATIPLVIPD